MNKYYSKNPKLSKSDAVVIYSDSGKAVGRVYGDTFKKSIVGSKHLLKKPPAIAFDVSTLEQAIQAGASRVEVFDKENQAVYRTTIKNVKENGLKFNRGFGEQIALPIGKWGRTMKGKPMQPCLIG